ncbi:MAG TPA: hypothetical protein VFW40_01345, partial [Capsulimonadaceae bacterium]|nr:hypothetical protein [Capsulimonadaceae bacterium]
VLHIVFGALGMLVAIGLLLLFGGIAGVVASSAHTETGLPEGVVGLIGIVICGIVAVLSLPGLIAGIGLLQFRPWARILGIIISGFDLLSVPLGTALGVYGLWVLLSNETEALFDRPNPYMGVRTY